MFAAWANLARRTSCLAAAVVLSAQQCVRASASERNGPIAYVRSDPAEGFSRDQLGTTACGRRRPRHSTHCHKGKPPVYQLG